MWIRAPFVPQARMPSMRPHPLNPRAPAVPAVAAPQAASVPPARLPAALASTDADSVEEIAARAGGFHESSYELNHGLEISESEWPPDVTVPGALGER